MHLYITPSPGDDVLYATDIYKCMYVPRTEYILTQIPTYVEYIHRNIK